MRRICMAALGVLAAVLLGISANADAAEATPTPSLNWLTNSYGPVQLYEDGVPTAWHSRWAIMNTGHCDKLPPGALPAYWFGDYYAFAGAVKDGKIAGKKPTRNGCKFAYKAVVVDYENWTHTPVGQRTYWRKYVKMAYTLAHSQGLTVIQAMTHGVPGDSDKKCEGWTGYFSCGAPHYEAQYADVVDIQAQQEEGTSAFSSEVKNGATQAKQANPHVLVLAGMRSSAQASNGSCTQISSSTLVTDWDEVSADADGAWLNVNCEEQTFVPLLKKLYG